MVHGFRDRESLNDAPGVEVTGTLALDNVAAKLRIPDVHLFPDFSILAVAVLVRRMEVAEQFLDVP